MAASAKIFKENWENKLEIDISSNKSIDDVSKATWKPLAAGITGMTPSAQETATTTAYFDGEGFSEHNVTGKSLQFQITGQRLEGDEAQDYIAGKFTAIGDELRTLARWTDTQGNTLVFVATLQAIVPFGGNANVNQTFSFTLAANGRPQTVTTSGTPSTPAKTNFGN